MASKPLFGDLIAAHKGLDAELKTMDAAADLTLLLHHAGMSREDLASKLGWSSDRLSQVLSGQESITVQTEVRAKLAKQQLTQKDLAASVDWARTQVPSV